MTQELRHHLLVEPKAKGWEPLPAEVFNSLDCLLA